MEAGLSVDELATGVGASATWLNAFEKGERTEELTYELLLTLVRATEPERPEWWDDGHEHDLHLGPRPMGTDGRRSADYWSRIDSVRAANRSRRERI